MARVCIFLIVVALIVGMAGYTGTTTTQYTLTISSSPGGTVMTPGEGTFAYDAGAVVSLATSAIEGNGFVRWTGDVRTIADINGAVTAIRMNGNYSINATFTPATEIRTWYDLNSTRNNLAGHYILMNDLDSNTVGYEQSANSTANGGKGWQPIGNFTGILDGQGYEIRDALIDRPDEPAVGLFSDVGQGGVIENLGMANSYVNFLWMQPGSTGNCKWTGGLAGENYGTVDNCYFVEGGVGLTSSASCGCLVGRNYGTVKNSFSDGQAIGTESIGGLVADNRGLIINCYSAAHMAVSATGAAGGLVGRNIGGTVMYSYAPGSVHARGICGGLIAVNNGPVSNCYATGGVGVYGKSETSGGLVGLNDGAVSDSYSTGSVTGNSSVGGLVGLNDGSVSDSYSTGSVTGNSLVGGLVGHNEGSGVSSSFWDIDTSGQTTSAGGTGLSTTEMQDSITFLRAAWNITSVFPGQHDYSHIWNIVDNTGYPFLSWFLGCHEGHTAPTQATTMTTPSGILQLTVMPAEVCAAVGQQIKIRCSIHIMVNCCVDVNSVDFIAFGSDDSILRERPMSAYTAYTIMGDEAYYKIKVNFTLGGQKYSEYGDQSFPITVGMCS